MNEEMNKARQNLAQTRDMLILKSHLFKGEARDKWIEAEKKWNKFEGKYKNALEAGQESSKDVAAAMKLLKDEIGESYRNIKASLH